KKVPYDLHLKTTKLTFSNTKLETTNNLIKVIKKNAFGFRKMKTRKTDFDALNSEKLGESSFQLFS
ncbi:transposase, partial [Streptococcus suis]|uniref:transposase n=1 Tax=Streptococcus suis TaxID=1307 RepID=UPI001374E027